MRLAYIALAIAASLLLWYVLVSLSAFYVSIGLQPAIGYTLGLDLVHWLGSLMI